MPSDFNETQRFANFRAEKEKAEALFSKLEEVAPKTFGSFPLAFFKDPKKNIRIVAHWVPFGSSGLLLLGYSPSVQRVIEEITSGLTPFSGQVRPAFSASLFGQDA